MSYSRTQYLDSISEIVLPSGHVTRKLDFIGTVRIYNQYYFNVYRRYNNVHEIVLEDFAGDFHFHKDYTVRESLQKVLCLSDEQIHGLHTIDAVSFKHRSVISEEVTTLRWTEVENRWYALDMNLGGILKDFHQQAFPKSPVPQHAQEAPQAPLAPRARAHVSHAVPTTLQPQNLSDRFAEVESRQPEENITVLRSGAIIRK
jgi:hypothetical protein